MAIRNMRVHGGVLSGVPNSLVGGRQRKFLNVPTFHDSPIIGPCKFDSKWEAQLCRILDDMVAQSEIRTFLNQMSICLPATSESGRRHMMRVDFVLITYDRTYHWWDAKWKATPKWDLQRNLAFQHHGIDVKPVYKGKPLPALD